MKGRSVSPMLLAPIYKNYIWGGERIGQTYQNRNPPRPCAESWEVSDREDGMCLIDSGPLKGVTLAEMLQRFSAEVFGYATDRPVFPLLIKLIDATDRLSIQVHPNESTAATCGGEPKTEAWYVLDAEPGASILVGLRDKTTPEMFATALHQGQPDSLMQHFEVRSGDIFFIPGGSVHAIGQGCFILEVQQNSNTTYRLWDWGRVGVDGKARDLHIDQAMQTINWSTGHRPYGVPYLLSRSQTVEAVRIIVCPYFVMDRYNLAGTMELDTGWTQFDILFASHSSVVLSTTNTESGRSSSLLIPEGRTCLVPAITGPYQLAPYDKSCEVIRIRDAGTFHGSGKDYNEAIA